MIWTTGVLHVIVKYDEFRFIINRDSNLWLRKLSNDEDDDVLGRVEEFCFVVVINGKIDIFKYFIKSRTFFIWGSIKFVGTSRTDNLSASLSS